MFKIRYLFFILIHLYIVQNRLTNKHKKRIDLVFAINDKYIDYFLTSLVSIFKNSDNNSIYDIYVQVSDTFEKKNMDLIYSLEKIYFNCFIHFINMGKEFSKALKSYLDSSTYYRLNLPILLPNIRRIIHIDSDSMILKDLMELYTLNFNEKYILGRLDLITSELDSLGIYTQTYINCGILLMDLYSLRKYNYVEKFNDYLKNHNNYKYLNHHDQTLINYVCSERIGVFRPKFHMWPFKDHEEIISFNNHLRKKYKEKDFLDDYDDPFIVHFPGHFKKKEYLNTCDFYFTYQKYTNETKEIINKIKNDF